MQPLPLLICFNLFIILYLIKKHMYMKRISITTLLILFITIAKAQLINTGFETWTSNGSYETPTGWVSYDQLSFPTTNIASVTKETDAKSGTYAAKIKVAGTSGQGFAGALACGNSLFAPGVYFTQRPTQCSFYSKYKLFGSDSVAVEVSLTKYNPSTGTSDDVGIGYLSLGGTQNSYTKINIAITYLNSLIPDSLIVLFGIGDLNASNPVGTVGSYIFVDDLVLGYPAGINEAFLNAPISIYPNPATEMVQINLNDDFTNAKIDICDVNGKIVYSGNETKINTSKFTPGLYIVKITTNDLSLTKKLIIE